RERRRDPAKSHFALTKRNTRVLRSLPREASGADRQRAVPALVAEEAADRQGFANPVRAAGGELDKERWKAVGFEHGCAFAVAAAVDAEQRDDAREPAAEREPASEQSLPDCSREPPSPHRAVEDEITRQSRKAKVDVLSL